MINFEKILSKLITEAPVGSKRERLLRAIKSRNPVSFYYNGPREEVLAGRRIKSELVAMGVTVFRFMRMKRLMQKDRV